MNWQLASLGGLVSLIASILFGHAWVISDYLIHPGCCSDLLPSRSDLPQYVRMIPGDMEAELSLPVEQLAFDSLDDPSNHARGKSLAGWLIPAEGSDRGGVVLVHDSGSDSRQMLSLVKVWNKLGFHVLLLESQEAASSRTYLGLVAQYDVLAAVAQLKAMTASKRVVTMGMGEGAAAALFAAQKSMSVDAVVVVDLHAESDPMMQSRVDVLLRDIEQLDGSASSGHSALVALKAAPFLYMNADVTAIVGTLASHIAVIRSSSWLTWLHGHSDPLKGIHRLQPRGLMMVQSKQSFGKSTVPIQKLYHRAGQCVPKLANLPEESAHPSRLSVDKGFKRALASFVADLD